MDASPATLTLRRPAAPQSRQIGRKAPQGSAEIGNKATFSAGLHPATERVCTDANLARRRDNGALATNDDKVV
jgi:hypothetical protein